MRHKLLPLLRNEFQPNVVRLLCSSAEASRHERNFLEHVAVSHLNAHGLAIEALVEQHQAVRAHVVRAASPVPISSERLTAIERMTRKGFGRVQLEGGWTVELPHGGKKMIFLPTKSIDTETST